MAENNDVRIQKRMTLDGQEIWGLVGPADVLIVDHVIPVFVKKYNKIQDKKVTKILSTSEDGKTVFADYEPVKSDGTKRTATEPKRSLGERVDILANAVATAQAQNTEVMAMLAATLAKLAEK